MSPIPKLHELHLRVWSLASRLPAFRIPVRRRAPLGAARLLRAAVSVAAVSFPVLASAADAHGGGGEGGSGTNLLLPPNVWAIISFLVVFFILVKKLLPPIVQVMDKRAEEIRLALEGADKARAERQALLETHQAEMERAKADVRALIDAGKADALKVKESIAADARREAEDIAAKARREIVEAKEQALDDLQKRSVDLALDLASSLIQKSLKESDHERLIQDRIKNLPNA
jgi:F-type H+-transporting ATPase subunit b